MRWRTFIAGLGTATAWPVMEQARQPAVPVIGFAGGQPRPTEAQIRTAMNGYPLWHLSEDHEGDPGRLPHVIVRT